MELPLEGVRIIDVATILAAPIASSLLAEFGADVIKVEQPVVGDSVREFPPTVDDVSLQWKVTNRNKRSVTLDLHEAEAVAVFHRLVAETDVVVMNFRPATAAAWGIDFDDLAATNPAVIVLHLTAFGRDGPYSERPGFARVAEAFAGLTGITGYPDRPPIFPGYPIGDGIAGVYAAMLIMVALRHRDLTGEGQLIDLGLYEPILRLMEDLVVRYDALGEVKRRDGNAQDHSCPNNLFPTADDHLVVLPASTTNMWRRLVRLIGDPALDEEASVADRVAQRDAIEARIAAFTRQHSRAELIELLIGHQIAVGSVNDAADICADPHIAARGNLVTVHDDELGRDLLMQGPAGRFSTMRPVVRSSGPPLGAHTDHVLSEIAGLTPGQIEVLRASGLV